MTTGVSVAEILEPLRGRFCGGSPGPVWASSLCFCTSDVTGTSESVVNPSPDGPSSSPPSSSSVIGCATDPKANSNCSLSRDGDLPSTHFRLNTRDPLPDAFSPLEQPTLYPTRSMTELETRSLPLFISPRLRLESPQDTDRGRIDGRLGDSGLAGTGSPRIEVGHPGLRRGEHRCGWTRGLGAIR